MKRIIFNTVASVIILTLPILITSLATIEDIKHILMVGSINCISPFLAVLPTIGITPIKRNGESQRSIQIMRIACITGFLASLVGMCTSFYLCCITNPINYNAACIATWFMGTSVAFELLLVYWTSGKMNLNTIALRPPGSYDNCVSSPPNRRSS